MSNPQIELARGLEAWFDFSPRYYDNQRDEVEDKSGNGRNAVAAGGPTIGVDGTRSFDAVALDGTDDCFAVEDSLSYAGPKAMFIITRVHDKLSTPQIMGNRDNGGEVFWVDGDGSFEYLTNYKGDYARLSEWSYEPDEGEWFAGVFQRRKDTDDAEVWVNGDLVQSQEITGYRTASAGFHIGAKTPPSDYFANSDIAVAARWSRDLSELEIDYLSQLAGPRRAVL